MGFSIEEKGQQALDEIRRKVSGNLKKWESIKISTYVSSPAKPVTPKEGDVWEERGKTWTIKNGIKQTVTKLDSVRIPMWCPECGRTMKSRVDDRTYTTDGKCHVCVIKEETRMRIAGTFEEYALKRFRKNQIAYVKDKIQYLESIRNELKKPQFHFIDGRFEEWNVDLETVKNDLNKDIEGLKALLQQLEEEIKEKD